MNFASLTWRSMKSRGTSFLLIVLSLSLSIALYLSVLGVQRATKMSFENAMTGVDLLVAPRGNDMQILLYSFFNIGEPTGTMPWSSVEALRALPNMRAVIPLSLGDSVGNFRVMGTDARLFELLQTSQGKRIFSFKDGMPFANLDAADIEYNDNHGNDHKSHGEHHTDDHGEGYDENHGEIHDEAPAFDVVIGAKVAEAMELKLGQSLVVAHGFGGVHNHDHEQMPFSVSGILDPTGTPFDSLILVHHRAIDAIHIGYQNGRQLLDHDTVLGLLAERGPAPVSAAIVLADSKLGLVGLQRAINAYELEPLTAVLPGVALAKIWQLIGAAEKGFQIISLLVIIVALVALMAMTLTSLDSRRRELAILRSVGASPSKLVLMLLSESLIIALTACAVSIVMTVIGSYVILNYASGTYGLAAQGGFLWVGDLMFMLYVILAALVVTLWPAIQLYRRTIHDGITIRH